MKNDSRLRSNLNQRPFVLQVDEEGPFVVDTSQHGDDDALLVYCTTDPAARLKIAEMIQRALNDYYGLRGSKRQTLKSD